MAARASLENALFDDGNLFPSVLWILGFGRDKLQQDLPRDSHGGGDFNAFTEPQPIFGFNVHSREKSVTPTTLGPFQGLDVHGV